MPPKTYVIDCRHPATPFDEAPRPAIVLAEYFRSIVRAATAWRGSGVTRATALRCVAKPRRRRCVGRLLVRRGDVPPEIAWQCLICGESGVLSHWQGTDADLSGAALAPDSRSLASALIAEDGFDEILRLGFPGCERLVHGAALDEEGVLLRGTASEFDDLCGWVAGEANHARTGTRQDLLDAVFEEVEAAAR